MKNAQEISEMAEREYKASYNHFKNILKQAYIKGYQAAQEEMKQEEEKVNKYIAMAIELLKQEGYKENSETIDYLRAAIEKDRYPNNYRPLNP